MTPIELTVFQKTDGPLTKRITLRDGKICNDSSACFMANGTARRVTISSMQALADLINGFKPNEAYALGRLKDGLPGCCKVVRRGKLDGSQDPSAIARTLDFLGFNEGQPGLALLDYDSKGMSEAVVRRMQECGGDFWGAICEVMPAFETVAAVERASTSSGLRNRETGETFPGSGGRHVVIPVVDAADIPRFVSDLHDRCWLAGFGWGMVSAAGSFLERSIVDRGVGSAERLIFEGTPIIELPLEQNGRDAKAHDGSVLDTQSLCPPLTDGEKAKVRELKAAEELRLLPERQDARAKWSLKHIARLTASGMPEADARSTVDRWIDRKELSGGDFPLPFDDPKIAGATVANVLAAPDQYVGKTLSDPFEGPAYGRGKAIVYQRANGSLFIHSFAHGETTYELHAELGLDDFAAYMVMHNYIFLPTREMWPAASVNSRVKPIKLVDSVGSALLDEKSQPKSITASHWLDQNRPVEQITWAPGEPMLIKGRLIHDGGWIERPDCTVLNLYRPPALKHGNAADVQMWLGHLHRVYPDDANHILHWLAHRVQRPQEKINHALVLGGLQGIGKDTLVEPVKRAVGPWNVTEVSPQHLLGRFNGFLKSVILRVNEARDLGEVDRFAFYDHMKAYTAAPPDVLRVDEKNLREYSVPNCCGLIITTNHKTDGIFLPADDRRHYVAWSDLTKDDFTPDYWTRMWSWYDAGGDRHVAAYLAELDLSKFDPKAPPPKTGAFWDIADANRAPEDAELADVLDAVNNPDAVTLTRVQAMASGDFQAWLQDRKNRRAIPYRFEQCGYVPARNDAAKSGLWVVNGKRQVIYAKACLSVRDRLAAARRLTGEQ